MKKKTGVSVPQDRLAASIAASAPGMTNADAKNILQIVIRAIAAEVRATGDATIGGLGRFRVVRRTGRHCYIPSKGEVQYIEPRTVLKIEPSQHFVHRCIDETA